MFSVRTLWEPQLSFYCNLWRGICAVFKNVTFGVENTWAVSVKFILPLLPPPAPVFCAMTCRNPVSRWEPMCYGSVLSVSCCLWSRVQSVFCVLRWSVQSIFIFYFPLLPPVIVCVLRCECGFYFSALWIFLFHIFRCQYFYFFKLVIKYIFTH